MEKTLTRRNIIAAAAALTLPSNAKASADSLDAKLDAMAAILHGEGVSAMEIMTDSHAPYYLKGEAVIIKASDRRPGSHVVCQLKTGKHFIAELVHIGGAGVCVRGLKPSDRMQVHPWKSVKSLARILATYRA